MNDVEQNTLPITVLPRLDIARDRRRVLAPVGATLFDIVTNALPDLSVEQRGYVRVSIGDDIVPAELWTRVRPKANAPVVIRVVPSGSLRAALMIAVAIAAIAVGQFWVGPALAGTFGFSAATWAAIGTSATMIAGSLLVNALVPMTQPGKDKQRYAISGAQNSMSPDAPLPLTLGTIRFAPPYGALPYTEDVSDEEQYFYGLYAVGVGRHQISDIRIGDTPIAEFKGVQIEVRQGLEADEPFQLINRQVVEEAMQVQLSNEDGPVRRVSGGDASELSVSIRFPGGLVAVSKDGDRKYVTVQIRIRCRLAGTAIWTEVTVLNVYRRTQREFRVSHRWQVATRGRYEVEITRITADYEERANVQATCHLIALRTFRPEYPINMSEPFAGFALRIRATRQLQGMLDNISARVSPVILDWDAETEEWVERVTRNPASLARYLLQGPQMAYPLPDDEIDLEGLQDWHAYCALNGLFYDGVVTEETKLRETLAEVCAAGRARPLDRGSKWGVVIDRPVDVVTAVISPRNARGISWSPQYVRYPDAVRVRFQDRSNDYKSAERVIPWIGFTGDPQVVEEWPMPGKTDADEIWRATRRRMRELILRPYPYKATQDVEHLAVEPGDRVMLSHEQLAEEARAVNINAVRGRWLSLDAPVTMSEGQTYRARIRDAEGGMRVATIETRPGEWSQIRLATTLTPAPQNGDLVLFGRYGEEGVDCVVSRIEPGDDWTATISLLPHAPELDALTAAETPPAWDGRAGGTVSDTRAPAAPRFASIASGYEIPDQMPGTVLVTMAPAVGDTVPVRSFQLRHRYEGDTEWSVIDGSEAIASLLYAVDDDIELQVAGVSWFDIVGEWSSVRDYTVLPMIADGPALASFTVDRLANGQRRYTWTFPPPADEENPPPLPGVQLRYRAGSWLTWDDLYPLQSGALYSSPYESSEPAMDGLYTFAARALDGNGGEGPPIIIEMDTQPTAPLFLSAIQTGDDINVSVTMSVALDSGNVRVYRSLASEAASTETDVSGLLDAPAGSTVLWTDVSAAESGEPDYRYRARAENDAGVKSLPTNEALP